MSREDREGRDDQPQAWVVGGSQGIGEEIARRLVAESSRVVCLSRSGSGPAGCTGDRLDLRCPGGMLSDEVAKLLEKYGVPDALIVSSGMGAYLRADSWSDSQVDDLVAVNLTGPLWLVNTVALAMRKEKIRGKILLIGSTVATRGANGLEVYAATKAALRGYIKSACRHLVRKGISLMLLEPGWTESPMTRDIKPELREAIVKAIPANRMATTAEVARVAYDMIHWPEFCAGTIVEMSGGA